MKASICALFLTLAVASVAQDKGLPYDEIPNYPERFTAGAVTSRMIDGLGFRYYWATEGLRKEDLSYKPSAEARTSEETLQHIYELSLIIANSATGTVNRYEEDQPKLSFMELRKITLENFRTASDKFRNSTDQQMSDYKLVFKGASGLKEFPFWNEINGPISDCLWHVGQVVTFRRSSGNPFSEKANVFTGRAAK